MKSLALSEYQEQCIVAEYMRKRWPDVLFTATLGGVRVSIGAAVKLKKQGYLKGVPDLLIFQGSEVEHYAEGYLLFRRGLAIEMKVRKGGVVSPEQKEVMRRLEAQGWQVLVAHGADEAIRAIEDYLKEAIKLWNTRKGEEVKDE